MAAITYLEEKGDLVVEAAGVRQGYRLLQPAGEPARNLCGELSRRFQQREEHDIARVRRVLAYAEAAGCLTQPFAGLFRRGARSPAGIAGAARGSRPAAPAAAVHAAGAGRTRAGPRSAGRGAWRLAAPRQLTRFLCGIASPAATRAKLRKHALFGTLETVPFHEVLRLAEQACADGDFGVR